MEGDVTAERLTEKACTDSTPPSVSVLRRPCKMDDCSNSQAVGIPKQASSPVALSLVTPTKSPSESSHTGGGVTATLENETVWSRFHSVGTEMILTKQGRRMFPCCRFRLSGLDPGRRYMLVMDIVPVDAFIHKWSGRRWEPDAVGEQHMPGQACVHPESPALGQQWMEGLVSFYKVKLTNGSTDQEGCVFLQPMQRYQPRLHVVPVDSDVEEALLLDSPKAQLFTFPVTEFYAVTSYQNPQITQLKIDCNPFAMAFRKDVQSIHPLQDSLGICPIASPPPQPSRLNLASFNSEQNGKPSELKEALSPCTEEQSKKRPFPEHPKEEQAVMRKTKHALWSSLNDVALCKEVVDSDENNKRHLTQPAADEHVAQSALLPSGNMSIQEPTRTTVGPVSLMRTPENSKVVSEDSDTSLITNADGKSPAESAISAPASVTQERMKLKASAVSVAKPSFFSTSQVNRRNGTAHFRCKPFRRARKAKSKLWSNVRTSKSPPVFATPDATLKAELEDVEGMVFVSFSAKEVLDVHVQNMEPVETPLTLQTETQNQPETPEAEEVILSVEERISQLESALLCSLKQQKHRQVIHPLLQEVGIKLNLLDPKISIDLQYLGVRLPFPPLIGDSVNELNSSSNTSSLDGAGSFVSRTGKTSDPTQIKGWRDKCNTIAPEGVKNKSAFCSEMLDEYLENEAQQISDRVAVFSKSSSTPVSYQLPSKSSSYVVTLDSLLKARSAPLSRVFGNRENIQKKPALKSSPENSGSFYSIKPYYTTFENGRKRKFAPSFQLNQATNSTGQPSTLGAKNQPNKPNVRSSFGMTSAKTQMKVMLRDLEEEALSNGKIRTHITLERASFALSSLLTSQKYVKKSRFSTHHHRAACPEEFCRLGCICDSLHREIRGPTHCRRVQCMFDCNCFKHKVLLINPSNVANVQRPRRSAPMAFSITDSEKGNRPPPATSITTLWKSKTEHDPEPLYVTEPARSLKTVPRIRTYVPRLPPQMREEDKDPVYLFFESKMTCARVREYNSNPPPQVHMLPCKKASQGAEKPSRRFESGVAQNESEKAEGTPATVKPDEPAPTKLLEILSECNWEPHRNLVLSALFGRMSNSLLSEPFCLGMYKIQLLSTTLKKGEKSSTITYKVCISRAAKVTETSHIQPAMKRTVKSKVSKSRETQTKTGNTAASPQMASQRSSSPLIAHQPKPPCKKMSRIFPLVTSLLPAGYLKAAKRKPSGPVHGLIKVNGKTYNQAKVSLGQMGALHPANRVAAFVTGRLQPRLQDQPKVVADASKPLVAQAPVVHTVTPNGTSTPKPTLSASPSPHPANDSNTVSTPTSRAKLNPLRALSNVLDKRISQKENASVSAGPPPAKTADVPAATSSNTGTLSAKTAVPAALPPGQQVVLQHLPGLPGSNFFCQYNGQIIQLVPFVQPQGCISEGSSPQVTCLPKDTNSAQKTVQSTTSSPMTSLNIFPVIAPKILSLSGSSGMNIASGTPAFNLQSNFPGKTGTFSFRICPPSAESKSVGSQQGTKCPDPFVATPSALVLPGGFTLIKLPLESHPGVPSVPADAPSSVSTLPSKFPQKDECTEKGVAQSCSSSSEQTCHVSVSSSKLPNSETLNSDSTQTDAAGSSALTAKGVQDQLVENNLQEQKCQISESSSEPSVSVTGNRDLTQEDPTGLSSGNCALTSKYAGDELVEKDMDSVEANNKTTWGKYDWVPEGAEIILKSDNNECESECEGMDDWPPKGAERVLWMAEDSADEEEKEDFSEQMNGHTHDSVRHPAGIKAKTSNTTAIDSNAGDCKTSSKEDKDISDGFHIRENGLSSEADEQSKISQSRAEQRLLTSVPAKGKAIVKEIFNNRTEQQQNNSNNRNDKNEQDSSLEGPSGLLKQAIIEEKYGPLTLIQTEPTKTDMVANQPSISEQCPSPESCSVVSKREATNDHFDVRNQSPVSVLSRGAFTKLEPYIDPHQIDGPSDHLVSEHTTIAINNSPMTDEQTTSKNTITGKTNPPDPSKQNVDSSHSLRVLNTEKECNNLCQTESTNNTNVVQVAAAADDDSDFIDIEGDVPCPLLEGQTPAVFTLSNTASENTTPNRSHPYLNNKDLCKFGKQLYNNVQISKTAINAEREYDDDATEDKKLKKRNALLQLKKSDQETEEGISRVTSSDGHLDSDSSECSSDINDKDLNSNDGEDSNDDTASTSKSETSDDSANSSSKEDIDIETFDNNEKKRMIKMMKNPVARHRKSKESDPFMKQPQRTDISNIAHILLTKKLSKRLRHSEKERVRRGEMRKSFASLKAALNIEEQIKMCKDDILIQAHLMIRALEERNRTLKGRKKALLQKRSSYVKTIAQLSEMLAHITVKAQPAASGYSDSKGRRIKMVMERKEECERMKNFNVQNLTPTSVSTPQTNPRHLDSLGNQLPPRLNFVEKGSKKSDVQTSITNTEAVDKCSDTSLSSPVSAGSHLNGPLPSVRPETGLLTLPKNVLQSFGETDTEKLEQTPLPSSPQATSEEHSLDITLDLPDTKAGKERGDSSEEICKGEEKSSVSEESTEEKPVPRSPISERFVEDKASTRLEPDKQTTVDLVKVTKRRSKRRAVKENALSAPDALGPRVLRNRSPAASTVSTRSKSRVKRQRII